MSQISENSLKTAFRLICTDTIEENIAKLQETKLAIADVVLTGADSEASAGDLEVLMK